MDLNIVAFIFLLAAVVIFLLSVFFYGANSFNGTKSIAIARVYKVGFTLSAASAIATVLIVAFAL